MTSTAEACLCRETDAGTGQVVLTELVRIIPRIE
jgi:hypothetical protein